MPLERRSEQKLTLRCLKLSVEELLSLLSFDYLIRAWRLDTYETDLRLSQTIRHRNTEVHEQSQKLSFARSSDLPSVLATPRLHLVLPSMSSDPVTDVLRTELATVVIHRYGRPLRAFLEWDLDHVMVNQRISNCPPGTSERALSEPA